MGNVTGKLSTHILDTVNGGPAEGVRIELWREESGELTLIKEVTTNGDGRTDEPLLVGPPLVAGVYRIVFYIGDYFRSRGNPDGGRFLDRVPIDFRIDDPDVGWHVPLLASPWAYSTYRGS